MFEIKENKDLITANTSLKELGLEYDTVGKLCIQGYRGFERTIFEIKEWLEAHYRMYQYKKDNGVKYGEHELFYWHNCDDRLYFTVDIEHRNVNDAERVANEIISHISNAFSYARGYITRQYESVLRWNDINCLVLELDTTNTEALPLAAIARIALKSDCIGNTLKMDARDKLAELKLMLLTPMCDKRVFYDTGNSGQVIKGTLRRLSSGQFGVFKPRARKTYYPVGLNEIDNLKIA